MQSVDSRAVHTRFSNGLPRTVDRVCPHCMRESPFEARVWHEHGRHVAAADAHCARCGGLLILMLLRDDAHGEVETALYAHPASPQREQMPGVDQLHALSAPLGRSYDSAIALFNRAEWAPAALTLRHLLEGVTARLAGEDARELPLAQQLDMLAERVDLARPLKDVAELMAPAGALGKAFDDEAQIDRTTTEQLVELTELMIAYLVTLPGAMADVRTRIASAPVPLRRGSSTGGAV